MYSDKISPAFGTVLWYHVGKVELPTNNNHLVEKAQFKIWLRPVENKALNKLTEKHNLSRSELLGRLIIQANAKT